MTKLLQTTCRSGPGGDSWCHPGGEWPVFALGISHWSQKHFRNVPQSDPLAPAQLTRRPAIGSSGGQLSENTAGAANHSLSLSLSLQSLPIVAPVVRGADTVTHPPLTTTAVPCCAGPVAVKTQLWAERTMGASQDDEAPFPGSSPWHVGERCYTLG